MAALVTFIGGEDAGNVAVNTWEDPMHGCKVEFPINEPVLIDPDAEPDVQRKRLLLNILRRAPGNRFFEVVTDVPASADEEPRRRGRPPRSADAGE